MDKEDFFKFPMTSPSEALMNRIRSGRLYEFRYRRNPDRGRSYFTEFRDFLKSIGYDPKVVRFQAHQLNVCDCAQGFYWSNPTQYEILTSVESYFYWRRERIPTYDRWMGCLHKVIDVYRWSGFYRHKFKSHSLGTMTGGRRSERYADRRGWFRAIIRFFDDMYGEGIVDSHRKKILCNVTSSLPEDVRSIIFAFVGDLMFFKLASHDCE
jgi:hypothetical protein